MKPKLIAFPVDDICCRVWCPFCARWHTHGYVGEEGRSWAHRVAHCADKTFFPQGYWIKLASEKDRLACSLPLKQVRVNSPTMNPSDPKPQIGGGAVSAV